MEQVGARKIFLLQTARVTVMKENVTAVITVGGRQMTGATQVLEEIVLLRIGLIWMIPGVC